MAKITLDLNQFKASGIYTVEFDASERIVLTTETIRLVVGFSRRGPFNAPVFLRDLKTARQTFGNIDTFLEKRGSFFHRSIETCLLTGPIFALNLMPLNNAPISSGGDAVEYRSFSLDVDENNGKVSRDLIASFYNKERFWFADTENFIAIVNNNALNRGKLFNLVNLSQTPMSFIVRKADPKVQGYELTAREWYGAGNVPEYINDFDFIEDYFIEIIAVEGDWSDFNNLSLDPVYSRFFDKRGIRVNRLNEFLSSEETRTVASFVGSIIPDFVDGNGSNQFIEVLVNNAVSQTGIFISINREALDDYENSLHKVDLVGHDLINPSTDNINFLSYNSPISKNIEYVNENTNDHGDTPVFTPTDYALGTYNAAYVKSLPIGGNSGYFHNVLVVPKPAPSQTVFTVAKYQEILDNLTNNSIIATNGTTYGADYVKVDQVIDSGTEFRVILSNPEMSMPSYIETPEFLGVDLATDVIEVDAAGSIITGDIILVEIPGWQYYFEVASVNPGAGLNNGDEIVINLSPSAVPLGHSPEQYVAGLEELTELATVLGNATVSPGDVEVFAWTNISVNEDFVINFSTSTSSPGFEIVYSPDAIFVHTTDDLSPDTENEDYIEAYPGSKLSEDIIENRVVDGDEIYYAANAWNHINVSESWGDAFDPTSNLKYGLVGTRLRQYSDGELTNQVVGTNNDFVTFGNSWIPGGSIFNGDLLIVSNNIENLRQEVDIVSGSINAAGTQFGITETNGNKVEIGFFIVNADGDYLTRVTGKRKTVNQLTGNIEFIITTTTGVAINGGQVSVFTPISKYADRLQFTTLSGFKLNDFHLPKNQAQVEKIYGVIENTNLGKTLASADIISFRYIVDTMKFGIAPQMGPKAILSRLAKKRQKCMALLNAPSMDEFINSTDPRFTDEPNPAEGNPRPILNTEYISTGGNLTLGPSFRFSLPDEENGAKFFGVFAPFFSYRENNKTIQVPPAADVSNNFIRKFLNGQPFSIVAGPRRGVISNPKLVGLEYEFTLEDREFLEPFGINPIVTVRNIGIMIYGNQSGFQRTLSAFNDLHVRDLLITVSTAVEDVLTQYLFEFNDAATRLEIKSIVENFLDGVRNAGGIFEFLVVMDETNNKPETIDQKFGIIDIGIEPARGMQKFVNRVTILKTGAISSGGFTVA